MWTVQSQTKHAFSTGEADISGNFLPFLRLRAELFSSNHCISRYMCAQYQADTDMRQIKNTQ